MQEVDAHQPAAVDLEPALFADLAAARIPRRLTLLIDLAAGNRPPALVGRLEDEQPSLAVEDQGARRCRDARRLILDRQ
jgi:hypothetical protein